MIMAANENAAILIEQHFDSFEEFTELVNAWNADFRQLDAEQYKSNIFQASVGDMLISSARLGCHVEQHGETPGGMHTFAVPDIDSSEMYWFGHTVGQDTLLVFPAHREIDVFTRPGFNVMTFSIPEELLLSLFESKGILGLEKTLGREEKVIQSQPVLLNSLRYLLRTMPEILKNSLNNHVLTVEIQDQILSILIQILDDSKPESSVHQQNKHMTLKRALDYIHDHADADRPLRVTDICKIARVSERCLQNIFKQKLGMTPKNYLTGYKLYEAHRELWRAEPNLAHVSDIANNWGFWHMGHFAADYRRMFGELPSDTLKRAY